MLPFPRLLADSFMRRTLPIDRGGEENHNFSYHSTQASLKDLLHEFLASKQS